MENAGKQKHPKGLWLVNTAMTLQGYCGYAFGSIFILFLTADVSQNGLGLSVAKASSMIAIYSSICYLSSIVGGWITDNYLGIQKSLILACFVNAIGDIALFVVKPSVPNLWGCFSILVISSAFFKSQISQLVGSLYDKDDLTRKDAAYALFYSAINIGAFFGPIMAGLITDKWCAEISASGQILSYGYRYIFLINAVVIGIVGLIVLFGSPKLLGDVGKYPVNDRRKKAKEKKSEKSAHQPLTKLEKNRIFAMAILFVFVVLFWAAWFQTQMSFSILMKDLVNRTVGGFTIPVPWFVAYNSILCVVFGPIMAKLWIKLGNRKQVDLSIPTKMALGMILTASAFILLILGLKTLNGVFDGSAKMNIVFVLIAYIALTVGELCISPIGMAMFNKLAPVRYGSLAMGAWYLSNCFANLISGKIAGLTESMGYIQIFATISIVLIVFALMLFVLRKGIVKLMALDEIGEA